MHPTDGDQPPPQDPPTVPLPSDPPMGAPVRSDANQLLFDAASPSPLLGADTPCDELTGDVGRPSGLQRRVPPKVVAGLLVVALGAVLFFVAASSPFVLITPGPTFDLTGLVEGDTPDTEFSSHAPMLLTTVEVEPLRWYELVGERISPTPDTQIFPSQELGATPGEANHVAGAQMRTSKEVALALAADRTGFGGPLVAQGAAVVDVVPDSPADAAGLEVGDVIVSVASTQVVSAESLTEQIASATGPVELVVERRGAPMPVQVTPELRDGERRIGVQVTSRVELPEGLPELDVDLSGVGGPSGGLMLTLGFIDALSPGDLAGGRPIAGTGTIDPSGAVGPISGSANKAAAVRRDGVEVFFVPSANAKKMGPTPGVQVIPVDTVDDALRWLCDNGSTDEVCASFNHTG